MDADAALLNRWLKGWDDRALGGAHFASNCRAPYCCSSAVNGPRLRTCTRLKIDESPPFFSDFARHSAARYGSVTCYSLFIRRLTDQREPLANHEISPLARRFGFDRTTIRNDLVPGGNGSARARHDIDEARRVSECASESIESARGTIMKRVSRRHVEPCPRREWSARARHDIDEARRVSECASESIESARETIIKRVSRRHVEPCPRRESNPHLRFRKPSFYPLNYGDAVPQHS